MNLLCWCMSKPFTQLTDLMSIMYGISRGDESHHTVHYGIVLWSFSSYTIRKEPKHIQQRKRTIYPVWIDLNWNIQESFLYSYVPSSSLDTSTPSCGPSHFRRFCYLSNAPTPIPSTASIMALPMTPGPPTIPCFRLWPRQSAFHLEPWMRLRLLRIPQERIRPKDSS